MKITLTRRLGSRWGIAGLTAVGTIGVLVAVSVMGADVKATPDYTYRGRKVSEKWIDQMLEEFRENLGIRGGKMIDLQKDENSGPVISSQPPPDGSVRTISGKIFQMDGERAALVDAVSIEGKRLLVHVTGLSEGGYADEQRIHFKGIYAGTHKYQTTGGGEKTVQDYSLIRNPTREEFTKALKDGFILIRYSGEGKARKETRIP